MSSKKKVGIIGSGVAGLATAIRLSAKGYAVTVFEKEKELGGKMGILQKSGYRFDTGPSLFTQPYLIDEIIKLSQQETSFNYQKMDITCKYFWEDGTCFNAYAKKTKLSAELKSVFPEDEIIVLERLLKAEQMYNTVGDIFIEKPLHKWSTWFSLKVIKALFKLPQFKINKSMHLVNAKDFKSPKIQQLFDRFATYNGSNPYQAPAILNMIPHLELNQGTFYPNGGLRSIPETLISIGKKMGVEYKVQEAVGQILINNKKVKGLSTSIKDYDFDIVVSNADVLPTYKYLMPGEKQPKKILSQERSSSGIIFYWGIKNTFPDLDLHNIFFSQTYKKEFEAIFKEGKIIDDPTIYVNISSKVDFSDAPEGCENWFVLINAPANNGQDWDTIIKQVRKNTISKLERILGRAIEPHIEFEEILDPRSIENKTSSFQGALYGTSSNNQMAAFLRHRNEHSKIKGLYFCGGSVHPGGGIPLCLNSAQIVSNML